MHTEKRINMEEGKNLPTDLIRQRAIGVATIPKGNEWGIMSPP